MTAGGRQQKGVNEGFRETVAQWRLHLRTEVKKTSSLPSAMFDACDPMLETRLAESAEAMLACLQDPADRLRDRSAGADKRLENVSTEDMRRLPASIDAVAPAPLDLGHGLLAEYLGVLTDAACHATGPALHGAMQLLRRDFGLAADLDAAVLADLLAHQVEQSLATCPDTTEASAEQIAAACQRLATALALHRPEPDPRPAS